MGDIIGLVLPFFGMIFLGAFVARITRQPLEALGWMNTFIIYVALPALFFQMIARTPVEQLTEWGYILGSVLATFSIFLMMFVGSLAFAGGNIAESTIRGLASAYGNIGYMGPGLALLALGPDATVPVALIFCVENVLHFTIAPMMMAVAGSEKGSYATLALRAGKRIAFHPFIIATAIGVVAAIFRYEPPAAISQLLQYLAQAAAPCALFAMGVTLALRPLKRVPPELGAIAALKLLVHPLVCYFVLSLVGDYPDIWMYAAILLAALPTATNVFVIAQQYGVYQERASASILVTTMLSVGTVTGLLYLIKSGILPPDLFP